MQQEVCQFVKTFAITFGGILRLRAPTIWEGMAWFLPVRRTQKLAFEFLFIPPFLFI